jgi:N-methylhydantoinase B
MAELGEGAGLAEVGRCQPPSMGVISGVDPRTQKPFINQLMLAATGGPGAPHADGWLTILGIGAAGFLFRDSVEIDEMKYPIVVYRQAIIRDSEGAGRYRGAPGAYVEYGPLAAPLEIVYLSDGTENEIRGVRGGSGGSPAQQYTRDALGETSGELGCYARVVLQPRERIISASCGGGGYGSPTARDPLRVAKDVREGWVSHERARDVYRVVIDDSSQVDRAATARLRRSGAET